MKKSLFIVASTLAIAAAGFASAQTAAPALTPGPVIPGICIYSVEDAIAGSDMGVAAGNRMRQLSAAVEAEIKPEATALQTERASLESQARAKTLAGEELQKKGQAWQTKAQALEDKAKLRSQELQATEQKAQQSIAADLDPQVRTVVTEKGCSMLVDRNAVLFANPDMDITGSVVAKLNATKKTITFERERLTAQGQPVAAAATAPKPVAAAPKPTAVAPKPATAPATAAPVKKN